MSRKNIKLDLISPKKKPDGNEREFWDYKFLSMVRGKKMYSTSPLALPTIAALTPPEVEISITDENIEDINFDKDVNLVGITSNTFLAPRAYEIADEFRKRGITVVLGGIHPSMLPQEAIRHADAVVIGEAENIWARLIDDYKARKLQQFYKSSERPKLENQPIPRWDLLKNESYALPILQTTRGCPYDCEFCSVKAFLGKNYRYKPSSQAIREIKMLVSMGKKVLFFADDNFAGNKRHIKKLIVELASLKITYMCQVSIDIAKNDEILQLLAKSGCKRVIIGFESISQDNLKQIKKDKSYQAQEYMESIRRIQSYGIEIEGSFIFGCDFDDESVFEKTVNFINESGLSSVVLNILTPYPGTRLYKKLERESRLLHKDWTKYDNSHVCFRPKRMSPEALQNGYAWVRQQVYSYESIFGRLRKLWELWNENNVRLWDRISPILINLDANDVAFSYPAVTHPNGFLKSEIREKQNNQLFKKVKGV